MLQNLPKKIKIVEVGPRDGFQNVKTFIPTDKKIAIIDGLIASGLKALEISSFVSPKAIPQMADAASVCAAVLNKYGDKIEASVLVPNLKGAQLAWEAGIREATCVISVSEAHNKTNVNRTHEESLQELARIKEGLPDLKMRVDLATVFACPFKGWVELEAVAAMVTKVAKLGIDKVVLCDTIGVATPDRVFNVAKSIATRFPKLNFSLHLHDTRGVGLVNTLAGMMAGITTYETAVGGLGGCPFAPGAAGNTATEDVVNMLADMGIETGVGMVSLLDVVKQVGSDVEADLTSHLSKAKIFECMMAK